MSNFRIVMPQSRETESERLRRDVMRKGASPSICCHIWCHIPICADNLLFLRLSVNMEFQEVTATTSCEQVTVYTSTLELRKWLYF